VLQLKDPRARECIACGQALHMQGLLILVVLAYLLLAPIGLIVAVVAFLKGRRFEARLDALEADATRLASRLRDVATSGTAREAPAAREQGEKVKPDAGPAIAPPTAAQMQAQRPPSTHRTAPESAEASLIDDFQRAAAAQPAEPPLPPKPEPPAPPVEAPAAAPQIPPPEFESAAPDVTPEVILEVARSSLPPAEPPKAKPPKPPFDWENLVGVKLFSWIAGIALVIAAVSFLRYSIDHGWLSPPVRMAIGLLAGVALLVVCELKAARKYPVTANALDGAGVAVLFATFFSAHVLWQLMPVVPTFMAMALVAATAVVLAIRRDSLFIALLGLVGGFATPFMLSSALDRPLSLFGYLVILNAGLAWVAYRRGWPVLTALSLAFTTIHQWVWVARFLNLSNIGIALAVFLVFPALAFAGLVLSRAHDTAHDHRFQQTAVVAAMLPLLFAAYMAVVPEFGARYGLLFGFLFLVVAGLAAVAVWRGPERLHLVGAGSTLVVFALWMTQSYPGAWPGILAFLTLFVLFFLLVPMAADRAGRPLELTVERSVLAAPALLFVFPALIAIDPRCSAPLPVFGALFFLTAIIAAFAIARREGTLHLVAAFFAVIAEAVWSVRYLTEDTLLAGLAVYGVFALFYLGVPMLARRRGQPLEPVGGAAALLLVSLGLLFFLALGAAAQAALWGLALLLVVLNAGLFFEGASGRLPALSIAGTALSWLVLLGWWATADVATGLVPALVVVAGFAVFSVAGTVFVGGRGTTENAGDAGVNGGGVYLLLVGHAFLLFVASRPELAVPPWPVLGVLLVLDVAAGVASLMIRRGDLFASAIGASMVVLLVFENTANQAPWPAVAVVAAMGVAALAVLWWPLARRRLGPEHPALAIFAGGAAGSLLLAQGIAIAAALTPGAPSLTMAICCHLVLVIALLVVACLRRWFVLAAVAVIPTFVAVSCELTNNAGWRHVLGFDVLAWAPFVVLPLLLGRRALADRWPWAAPVLASVPCFFLARHAMIEGGLGHIIGALPAGQAIVLAVVLFRLVRLEPSQDRDLGRLALVAAAVLGFVTLAIPLQLEKQWITIGWALEGCALAWLYLRVRHRGLLACSVGLLTVVLVRLAFNPAVFSYHARSEVPIVNWYLYTYLVAAAASFAAASLLRNEERLFDIEWLRPGRLLAASGTVLLFLLLNIEIADFFATGPNLTFRFSGASLAQDLSYTLGWAVFAIALLAAGVALASRGARITSIALLAATVLKAFLHDLPSLGGLYRVASFALLALSLAVVAVAIQKFVLKQPGDGEQ
jgi:uncharacterized membrane protein